MCSGIQRWVNIDSCKTTRTQLAVFRLHPRRDFSKTRARRFLPPLMLSLLPEDVSCSLERKQTCQRGECLHSAACTLSPPAQGSQTSGHHQAWAAQCRRADSLTVGRPFFLFQIPRILSRRGTCTLTVLLLHWWRHQREFCCFGCWFPKGCKTNFVSVAMPPPAAFSQLFIDSTWCQWKHLIFSEA